MNELNFQIAYGAFCAALVAVLLLVLARALRGTGHWRSAFVGFALGTFFVWGFGLAAEISALVAGILTGYLFARVASDWKRQMYAGALVSSLLMIDLVFAATYYGFKVLAITAGYSLADYSGGFFAEMVVNTLITTFAFVAFAGLGAILGGWLRKALKPAEPKVTSGSGVGQPGVPAGLIKMHSRETRRSQVQILAPLPNQTNFV